MAMLQYFARSKSNWEPASYTADETANILNVAAGDFSDGVCIVRVMEVFNGSGTDAIVIVGDGDDPNGYLVAGDVDETATGLYWGGGAYYTTKGKLYTTTDTIDIGFTANTAGTRTTGILNVAVYVAKVDPW